MDKLHTSRITQLLSVAAFKAPFWALKVRFYFKSHSPIHTHFTCSHTLIDASKARVVIGILHKDTETSRLAEPGFEPSD